MAEQSQLARLGLRTGTVGTSASLAIAFGNSGGTTPNSVHTAANRTGLYGDLTAAAEKIGLIVGGQTGPLYTRSGTYVNVAVNGTITANLNAAALPAALTGTVLQIGNADTATARLLLDSFGIGVGSIVTSRTARGTAAAPTATQSGDTIASHNGYAYGATGYSASYRGRFAVMAAENWTDAAQGTKLGFSITTNLGTTTYDAMVLGNDGVLTLKNGNLVGIALAPQGGAANFTGTITTVLLTANRTYTFPDASITIIGGSVAANQIAYGTGTALTSSSAGYFNGTNFAIGGTPLATYSSSTVTPIDQSMGLDANTGYGAAAFSATAATAPSVRLCHSKGATIGDYTTTAAADQLGSYWFGGSDGTKFVDSARLSGAVDAAATVSSGIVPGRVRLLTARQSDGVLQQAWAVDSAQVVIIGASTVAGSTNFTSGTATPRLQQHSGSAPSSGSSQTLWIANANAPVSILSKSRSAVIGTMGVVTTGDSLGTMSWQGDDGTNFVAAADIAVTCTGTIGTGQIPGIMKFRTATSAGTLTQAVSIDSSQVLVAGSSTAVSSALYSSGTLTPAVQVVQNLSAPTGLSIANFRANAAAGTLFFGKSRSSTIGTMTVVTTGDTLGAINWQGSDGTNFVAAATIIVTCTGTIGAAQIPGNMVFQTATAAGALATALTINNGQSVIVGSAALATNATDGFIYMPTCAGTPTGVPTAFTGRAAWVYDSTNNIIYVYNGAWKKTAALT